MQRILKKIRRSTFFKLFNFNDDLAKGRSCMILSAVMCSVISWLTTGLFYTSFLMTNGIDIVNIGILTFVPYIASCFSIFSPSILERFQKRKFLLAGSRIAYYTLNLLAITVMPRFVSDPALKMVLFVIIVFTANIINALFSSGYSVWQVKFIPDDVRADYFSLNQLITSFIGCGAALLSSIVADALSGSAYEDTIIIIFRYVAYALGVLDVVLLSIPKEFPYSRSKELPRLRHIITKPFTHKKFAITMAIVFVWTFCINAPQSTVNYYLINNVGVSYSFIYTINMFYPFFLLFFLPLWNKFLRKKGWFTTFALGAMLLCPTNLMYSCVTADNYTWLFPTLRLIQHFIGVGCNVAYANMAYINLPEKDQTNYIAFHTLVVNIAGFLGMMLGTSFVAAYPDIVVTVFGLQFTNVQMLFWLEALGEISVGIAVFLLTPVITPDHLKNQKRKI
ncbi:MAG: MFS transporter [Lachnospiraceae bacterium]|nr:MFS transporter [Lachnospiraceae bacterium]